MMRRKEYGRMLPILTTVALWGVSLALASSSYSKLASEEIFRVR